LHDRHARVLGVLLECLAIRYVRFDGAELQPLAAEVFDERAGFGVRQHPRYLRLEYGGCAQLARRGGSHQSFIRHAGPQEIRKPGRELVIAERLRAVGGGQAVITLDAEEEVRRDQNSFNRHADSLIPGIAVRSNGIRKADELVNFGGGRGPAVCARRKPREDLPLTDCGVHVTGEEQLRAFLRRAHHFVEWPGDVEIADKEAGDADNARLTRREIRGLIVVARIRVGSGDGDRSACPGDETSAASTECRRAAGHICAGSSPPAREPPSSGETATAAASATATTCGRYTLRGIRTAEGRRQTFENLQK